jgi:hypothetical protein
MLIVVRATGCRRRSSKPLSETPRPAVDPGAKVTADLSADALAVVTAPQSRSRITDALFADIPFVKSAPVEGLADNPAARLEASGSHSVSAPAALLTVDECKARFGPIFLMGTPEQAAVCPSRRPTMRAQKRWRWPSRIMAQALT